MGKTALTAEVLALWESRFEWVLLYQAKPNALGFDATLRDIHMKLYAASWAATTSMCRRAPPMPSTAAAEAEFTGAERLERLTRNLLRALRDEPILLVLDNFETNLKPQAEPGAADAQPLWACQDPAWDRCLGQLATALVGTPSRVLITCRRPLAALAVDGLPPGAARPAAGGRGRALPAGARRLEPHGVRRRCGEKALSPGVCCNASRFHPLLMDRLARLATGRGAAAPAAASARRAGKDATTSPSSRRLFANEPGGCEGAGLPRTTRSPPRSTS